MLRNLSGLIALPLALLLGCASTPGPYGGSVEFEDASGRMVFELRSGSSDSLRMRSESGALICQLQPEGEAVRVLDARGRKLGTVVPLQDGVGLLVRSETGQELYKLIVESDGDFKLRDASGANLYVGKHRSYGFKVLDASDVVESRVKVREGRVSVRDGSGQKYLKAKLESPDPLAMAMLTLQDVPIYFAAGLSFAVARGDHGLVPASGPGSPSASAR